MIPTTRPVRNSLRSLRRIAGRTFIPLLSIFLGGRSWDGVQRFGRRLGALAWRFGKRDRERALEHLALALPDLSATERKNLARSCFAHQGRTIAECLHLVRHGLPYAASMIDIEGWDNVTKSLIGGRSVLLISGHCGNWELLGPACKSLGGELTAVVRAVEDDWAEAWLSAMRRHLGSTPVGRGGENSARDLLKALRGGELLVMLLDQDIVGDGVWVPFFGQPAHTARGAADIAIKRELPVVPVFCERRPDGRHLVRFEAPLELSSDPVSATAQMTAAIEGQVRRHPEQWVWMHRRWRRRPPAPPAA